MSSQDVASYIPDPWYRWWRFPIFPHLRTRKADEQNTSSFSFHWLIFRVWSMDSVEIKVEIALDDQRFVARAMVPYLIFGIFVPVFPQSWTQKLWRKSNRWKRLIQEARE